MIGRVIWPKDRPPAYGVARIGYSRQHEDPLTFELSPGQTQRVGCDGGGGCGGESRACTKASCASRPARLAAALSRPVVGKPRPRTDRAAPIALRALLILGVVALGALVGDGAADRLASAFRFERSAAIADMP